MTATPKRTSSAKPAKAAKGGTAKANKVVPKRATAKKSTATASAKKAQATGATPAKKASTRSSGAGRAAAKRSSAKTTTTAKAVSTNTVGSRSQAGRARSASPRRVSESRTGNAIQRSFNASEGAQPIWQGGERRSERRVEPSVLVTNDTAEVEVLRATIHRLESELAEYRQTNTNLNEELVAAVRHLALREALVEEIRGDDLPTVGLRLGRRIDRFLADHPEAHRDASRLLRKVRPRVDRPSTPR